MPGENLRKTGTEMEDAAAKYLSEHGVRILERNFRSREAEIDIIGLEGDTMVFVEVKARRRGKKSGEAAEAVGAAKQKRICRCADYYMYEKGIDPYSAGIRFDVIAIAAESEWHEKGAEEASRISAAGSGESGLEISWIRNAFPYSVDRRTKPHWRVW